VVSRWSSAEDTVVCSTVLLAGGRLISGPAEAVLCRRRPECYGNITLDTFSHMSTETLLCLPKPADFTAAVVQFRPEPHEPQSNLRSMLRLIDRASEMAASESMDLSLDGIREHAVLKDHQGALRRSFKATA